MLFAQIKIAWTFFNTTGFFDRFTNEFEEILHKPEKRKDSRDWTEGGEVRYTGGMRNKWRSSVSDYELAPLLEEAKNVFGLDLGWTKHGPNHWLQVEKNAIMLGKHTLGCDMEVARRFAILHDCRRQNEGSDPEHGARASEFAQELNNKGVLGLDSGQLATLKYAMNHHNGGQVSSDPTIGVCWDADRLDLPRVGTSPNIDLMSTQYARKLLRL